MTLFLVIFCKICPIPATPLASEPARDCSQALALPRDKDEFSSWGQAAAAGPGTEMRRG